jgi:DNA end-binding protein Ku
MAARPTWKGYLRLSLVSCPIRLYPATTRRERVSFHLLDPKTHNRIELRPHEPGSGREVPRDTLVRGYEFDKGRYVVVDEDEIDALKVESSETIDLVRFVDASELDALYLLAPYYVAPEGKVAEETFRVIREAMRQEAKVGMGRLVLSTREHAVALSPYDRGMLLTTLRAPEEIRAASEGFAEIGAGKPDKEMVELARRLIRQKSGAFDPKELAGDHYQEALRRLVQAKLRGEKPVAPEAPARADNVVNLMDALKRSLATDDGKPAPSGRKRASRSAAPRRHRASARAH